MSLTCTSQTKIRKTLSSKEAESGYHNVMQFNYTHELPES